MDPAQVAAFSAHFQQQQPPQQPPYAAVNHPTPAANPTPNPSQPLPSHPSYAEMIMTAIQWENSQGKEGGSSKRAIEKYIDRAYTDLPPTHSALLTHHLKRLKNSGQLAMIKNSYQLPSMAPQVQHVTHVPVPVPVSVRSETPTPKRSRGRPPKVKAVEEEEGGEGEEEEEEEVVVVSVTNGKRGRGRPPAKGFESGGTVVGNGVVKRRGRPSKKVHYEEVDEEEEEELERAVHHERGVQEVMNEAVYVDVPVKRSPPAKAGPGVGRGRGRPKKAHHEVNDEELERNVQEAMDALGYVDMSVKRGPGRPPAKTGSGVGRGRPKKVGMSDVVSNVLLGPVMGGAVGKKRGRKPKGIVPAAVSGYVGKKRGRKPKGSVVPVPAVAKVEKKPYTGKPRGRPKRNPALVEHTSGQGQTQETANEDLLMKLEDMQSKLRDVVRVLRPHLAYQTAPDVLSALQQLEELSAMTPTPSPAVIAPPETTVPMDLTNPPQTTPVPESSAPSAPSLTAPTMMAFTASPGMNVPLLPFSMNVSSGIENQQPMSWIPSNDTQL